MKIIKTIQELKDYRKTINKSVGFVPTMGALHEGHLSLIKRAKSENQFVIVSIFVNPTQFLEGEDFDKYPRKDEADILICKKLEVDILFMPNIQEMYQKDELKILSPAIKGYILEGFNRPGHFNGVLHIVLKLFNLTKPTNAYFGKKDTQQLLLIKGMVDSLYLDINIVECDTIREKSGLALSSRNVYLTHDQKQKALLISKSLYNAVGLIQNGVLDSNQIKKSMQDIMSGLDIEYIAIINKNLQEIETITLQNTIILVAIKIGQVRLIDNIWV